MQPSLEVQTVSEFIVNTCRVNPKPIRHKLQAFLHCTSVDAVHAVDDDRVISCECTWISIPTGSTSEFYVEPMLPCFNDYDIMAYRNDVVAIPAGCEVPRRLPAEFDRKVSVCELAETNYPGFVLVKTFVGQLNKDDNNNSYTFAANPSLERHYATVNANFESARHGPAIRTTFPIHNSRLPVDNVICIHCPVWPPLAAAWPTRSRRYGWPDTSTVDSVVKSRCDVVQVAHPRCIQDEWMNRYQWRFSFSRPETILLNTWSVKQQLTYYIIRLFLQRVRPEGTSGLFHNYIIKTHVMKGCELHSRKLWEIEDIVSVCRQFIHEIARSVQSLDCRSYFAESCNLLDMRIRTTDETQTRFVSYLLSLDDSLLSSWLKGSYLQTCGQIYVSHLAPGFTGPFTCELSSIVRWNQSQRGESACREFEEALNELPRRVHSSPPPNGTSCERFLAMLQSTDSRFLNLYCACCLLRAAITVERDKRSLARLTDVILTIVRSHLTHLSSRFSSPDSRGSDMTSYVSAADTGCRPINVCRHFQTASVLMEILRPANHRSSPAFQLHNELAKVYLDLALRCDRADCSDFHETSRCVLNVYSGCLYCCTEHYETAVVRCIEAIETNDNGIGISGCVERKLVPCFEPRLDCTLGLILLYSSFLRQAVVAHRHTDSCTNLRADLLACYLVLSLTGFGHRSIAAGERNALVKKYKSRLRSARKLSVADVLLFYEFCRSPMFVRLRQERLFFVSLNGNVASDETQLSEFDTSRLRQLLMQLAVEYLTAFRVIMSLEFRAVRTIVTDDFQAMHAYQVLSYEECFRICDKNVELLRRVAAAAANAVTIAFLVQDCDLLMLLDNELASIIGLARLCGAFGTDQARNESFSQLTLSLYYLVQSKMKLGHSPASHFDALRIVRQTRLMLVNYVTVNQSAMIYVYRKAFRRMVHKACF